MATVLLFHHAHGLTAGVLAFADQLRAAGHVVDTPDLYGGRNFTDLDEGVAFGDTIYAADIRAIADTAADAQPPEAVYAGCSFGGYAAQYLAQTRPGAHGTLLYYGCVPTSAFDAPWPVDMPLQVHTMDDDPWAEMDVIEALLAEAPAGERFVYQCSGHLFADSSLADYDEAAARLLMERTLAFLERVG